MKYTKEILEHYVKQSFYMSDMIRKMGLEVKSGNHIYLTKKVREFNIDTSHWLSVSEQLKAKHQGRVYGKSKEEVLVKTNKRKGGDVLTRAMISSGITHTCSECGLGQHWNNKKLVLHVDHINGDHCDHRLENLRFLCPNCHSQTDTYCGKKTTTSNKKCLTCDELPVRYKDFCKKCMLSQYREKHWPTKERLKEVLSTHTQKEASVIFGVTVRTLLKWKTIYMI